MLSLNPESLSLRRLKKTSPSSDLIPPSPSKKSRPNSPEKHDSGMSGPNHSSEITDADIEKLIQGRPKRFWEIAAELPEPEESLGYDPPLYCPDVLPKGYTWGSYMGGSDIKKFAHLMVCVECGKHGDHTTDNCTNQNSEEAKKFRKQMACSFDGLYSSKKPENK